MTVVESLELVSAVVAIAFFAWLVRSFAESQPDPLLLNLTFFAFAGQCVLTAQLMDESKSIILIKLLFGLDLIAFILVLTQVRIVMAHASTTIEHYERVLRDNEANEKEIGYWAAILLRITGPDLFPEFYQKYVTIPFLRRWRDRRRQQAVSILPLDLFKEKKHSIDAATLTIEADDRKWLWRLYAGICVAAWTVFVICIGVGKLYQ